MYVRGQECSVRACLNRSGSRAGRRDDTVVRRGSRGDTAITFFMHLLVYLYSWRVRDVRGT